MTLNIGASKFTEPSSSTTPRIKSFFSEASKTLVENSEVNPTTDAPYDKTITQENVSKQVKTDKEQSSVSTPRINSFFSKASTTVHRNNEIEGISTMDALSHENDSKCVEFDKGQSSTSPPMINSFFSKASTTLNRNNDIETIPTMDALTQENNSKCDEFDEEQSSASTLRINSFFSKAFKALDRNSETEPAPTTASPCDKTVVHGNVSNNYGYDVDQKVVKLVRDPTVRALFVSGSSSSKYEMSKTEQERSLEVSPKRKVKCLATRLDSPNVGIKHFLVQKEAARDGEACQTGKWCNPYHGCRIDKSVLNSLPEQIQREIKSSFGNYCEPEIAQQNAVVAPSHVDEGGKLRDSERVQGMNIGLKELYADSLYSMKILPSIDLKEEKAASTSYSYSVNPNEGTEGDRIECEKCGKDINVWEMPVHLDYHFAKELELAEYTHSNSIELSSSDSIKEPPKKKKKSSGSIMSFLSK